MKLRLLAMGSIISVIGLALLVARGLEASYGALLGVGIVLLFLGLFWK